VAEMREQSPSFVTKKERERADPYRGRETLSAPRGGTDIVGGGGENKKTKGGFLPKKKKIVLMEGKDCLWHNTGRRQLPMEWDRCSLAFKEEILGRKGGGTKLLQTIQKVTSFPISNGGGRF